MIFPDIVFLISTQLRKNFYGRLFFQGIEVARAKDFGSPAEKQAINKTALERCVQWLGHNGKLLIFPEGTSTLGPSHLPFRNGAARVLTQFIDDGGSVDVVPIAIVYDRPWTFRSNVEIVVGNAIPTDLPTNSQPGERVDILHNRIRDALERIGVNFMSAEQQNTTQCLARSLTLGTKLSYYHVLKTLEQHLPGELARGWQRWNKLSGNKRLLKYHGIAIFSTHPLAWDVIILAMLGPMVLAAGFFNAVPLVLGQQAGTRFSDGRNVISLWRIVVGVPILLVWVLVLIVVALATSKLAWFALYAIVTWIGLLSYDRVKRATVAVYNGARHRSLAIPWRRFRCQGRKTLRM
jgi:hypothetical protein